MPSASTSFVHFICFFLSSFFTEVAFYFPAPSVFTACFLGLRISVEGAALLQRSVCCFVWPHVFVVSFFLLESSSGRVYFFGLWLLKFFCFVFLVVVTVFCQLIPRLSLFI